MPLLPLAQAFTARAIGVAWNKYLQSIGMAPYLGRSFFGTDKKQGIEMRFIKGRKNTPVELKASNFDAKAPLRDPIGFGEIQNSMPFFRESYMVTEKEEQEYMTYVDSENVTLANQVLKEIMKNPLDLVLGADVVPERMIWQLLAPEDGIPKIDVMIEGKDPYAIHYTTDNGAEYKKTNFIELTGEDLWSAKTTATPMQDLIDAQDHHETNYGEKLRTFVMNKKTWRMFVNADDTRKQVLGVEAASAGMMLKEADVKTYLSDNYGIEILVYNKMYLDSNGVSKTFIPDGVITAIAGSVNMLGTVWYGTTPEERSGDESIGSLSIVSTGVSIYTYTTPHPVNTHCHVSEIVLPSYENMDSVVVMKVA